jgi:hypothetical protein
MAGLDPAIHVLFVVTLEDGMPGISCAKMCFALWPARRAEEI